MKVQTFAPKNSNIVNYTTSPKSNISSLSRLTHRPNTASKHNKMHLRYSNWSLYSLQNKMAIDKQQMNHLHMSLIPRNRETWNQTIFSGLQVISLNASIIKIKNNDNEVTLLKASQGGEKVDRPSINQDYERTTGYARMDSVNDFSPNSISLTYK